MSKHKARDLFLRRGVVLPEYAEEIAETRKLLAEWDRAGEPLR